MPLSPPPPPPLSSPPQEVRIAYLDIARAASIILVILYHTWEGFTAPINFMHTMPGMHFMHTAPTMGFIHTPAGYGLFQVMQTTCRLSVTIFIMLTGALMLGRSYPDIPRFVKKKLPRFLGALFVTAIVYALLVHVLFGVDVSGGIGRFVRGGPIGGFHLWYLYMLIGLYLSVPYLARLLAVLSKKELDYLMLASLVLVMIPWTLADAHSRFAYFVSYSFLISTYMLYAVTGYWLHQYRGLSALSPFFRLVLLILVIAGSVLIKLRVDYHPGEALPVPGVIWYDSFFLYAGGTLLFSLFRDFFAHVKKVGAFTALFSRTAYAIYLWHVMVVYLVMSVRDHFALNSILLACLTILLAPLPGIGLYRLLTSTRFSWLVR